MLNKFGILPTEDETSRMADLLDELVEVDHRLTAEIQLESTPGHTPGHVIFFSEPHKIVIVGDVLFHGSIGRTDLPRGDHQTLLDSIRDQVLSLEDDVTFLPGHGPTSTIGVQRKANPFLQGL